MRRKSPELFDSEPYRQLILEQCPVLACMIGQNTQPELLVEQRKYQVLQVLEGTIFGESALEEVWQANNDLVIREQALNSNVPDSRDAEGMAHFLNQLKDVDADIKRLNRSKEFRALLYSNRFIDHATWTNPQLYRDGIKNSLKLYAMRMVGVVGAEMGSVDPLAADEFAVDVLEWGISVGAFARQNDDDNVGKRWALLEVWSLLRYAAQAWAVQEILYQ